jgi:hypothetical protein
MAGYVIVEPEGVASKPAVARWVERAWKHVLTLEAKKAPKRKAAKGKR